MDEQLAWQAGPRLLDCGTRTLVMGILNVTPDSFSDGGRFFDQEAAVARGIQMAGEGADVIDVGGESTRPGAAPVTADNEIDRVVAVIKRLASEVSVPISIDTRKSAVAQAAVDVGATIVNDVTAGADPAMFDVVRRTGAGMVLMHMRGEPATMSSLTDYRDVVGEVVAYLKERLQRAVGAGIARQQLVVDPGLGFAKTTEQSLLLMKEIGAFGGLGRPVLVGPSRKSFVGHVLGTEVQERVEGTAGAVAWLVAQGANIVRVHDVLPMTRVVRMVDAIKRAGVPA
jgi:dihydropteroate synthase